MFNYAIFLSVKVVKNDELEHQLMMIRTQAFYKTAFGRSLLKVVYGNQKSQKNLRNVICKEFFMSVPTVIYTQKNFFLLSVLNKKIEALKAAGLIDFWQSLDLDTGILSEKEPKGPKVLTMKQIMGSFQVLFFGYVISFLSFTLEIINHKCPSVQTFKKILKCDVY